MCRRFRPLLFSFVFVGPGPPARYGPQAATGSPGALTWPTQTSRQPTKVASEVGKSPGGVLRPQPQSATSTWVALSGVIVSL